MVFAEGNGDGFAGSVDGVYAQFFGRKPQVVAFDEGFDGLFGQAEAIDQFFVYGVDLLNGFADGKAFVEDEPFVDVGAVAFRQPSPPSTFVKHSSPYLSSSPHPPSEP